MAGLSLALRAVPFIVFAICGLTAAAIHHGLIKRPHRMRIVNRLFSGGFC